MLKKGMCSFLHSFRKREALPSWIVLLHQCQVDPVHVVEIHVEQADGQLWGPSMQPALSCQIILGLCAIPLVNEMEGLRIIDVLLWACNWELGSFSRPLDPPLSFDSSFNYLGVWKLERVLTRLLSNQIA